MRALLIVLLLMVPRMATADEWDDFVAYMTTQEGVEGEELAAQLEALEQIHLAPININDCSHVDLEQIGILTGEQVEDLVYYVARVGQMRTMGELVYIRSLDYDTRRWLPLFISIGEPRKRVRRLRLADGRHEALASVDVPLYRREGYAAGNERQRYQGARTGQTFKYRYTLGERLSAGLVFDKDQGEPYGRHNFYGGHVMLKNCGWLRLLVAGDYRVGFGEGLLINQHFAMGKPVQNLNRARGVAAKGGVGETGYMRGVAATVGLGRQLTATAFVSYCLLDATVDKATGRASSLSSVTTYRNANEIAKWHNTSETLCGAHVGWTNAAGASQAAVDGRLRIDAGVTAFVSKYHLPFVRGDEAYREFHPEGDAFGGVSVEYAARYRRWSLAGETATDGRGWATLERLTYRHSARLQAQVAYRNYAPQYHSFHSRALSEWGVQNESGVYAAVDAQPWRPLHFTFSADFFRSPHARYGIDHATSGQELRLSAGYTLSRRHSLTARVSWKHKEQHNIMHVQQRYLLGWQASLGQVDLRTQAQLAHYSDARAKRSCGIDLQQTVRWHDSRDRLRLAASVAWFRTDDYYGRVYLVEPAVIGGLSSAMLYGRGLRLATTARANLPRGLMLMLRYTFSRYFDRDAIGTALQTIHAPWQNDLCVQLRVKL